MAGIVLPLLYYAIITGHVAYFILFLLFVITLYIAKPLLEPVAVAGILAILFTPLSAWLEKKGVNKLIAAVICMLAFVFIVGGVIALFSSQFSTVKGKISDIKGNISNGISGLQDFILCNFSISISTQNKILDQHTPSVDAVGRMMTSLAGPFLTVLVGTALTLVYMALLISYRRHLKDFILKSVSDKDKAQKIVSQSVKVVQRYFSGLAIIIVCLWIMYGIGFSIVGIKGALFFALLCGTLEIIPFVGNITGSSLAAIMAFSQGGGISMVLWVLFTYAVIQSIQFYIISPFVFGNEISINPFFIIFILLAGELLWGVPGMVIAIPVMGIAKVIFDNVESLKPVGFLVGREKTGHRNMLQDIIEKIFNRKSDKKG